ncbi:hypothetical protein BN2475_1700003 [Paraburkholderia ribeironis]|uniref:Uncharacterized protein n=1 Tax=Paraburkholderia ribeironis TaxID=1247936 RepID=A0A1N7SS10_9BURK|nr:hypothetical protein BN2475_1700003 [Paraburkholderia ribeironis]
MRFGVASRPVSLPLLLASSLEEETGLRGLSRTAIKSVRTMGPTADALPVHASTESR